MINEVSVNQEAINPPIVNSSLKQIAKFNIILANQKTDRTIFH